MASHYYVGLIFYEQWLHDCIKEGRFIPHTAAHRVPDPKGEKKLQNQKKKALYTIVEVFELWHEIQRIKRDSTTYKFKGNLSSRSLWQKVEFLQNLPERTGESMRNFFKQWKNKSLPDVMKQIAEEKKMRYSFAFKYPRYPFVK